jgi:hypothetical protein
VKVATVAALSVVVRNGAWLKAKIKTSICYHYATIMTGKKGNISRRTTICAWNDGKKSLVKPVKSIFFGKLKVSITCLGTSLYKSV